MEQVIMRYWMLSLAKPSLKASCRLNFLPRWKPCAIRRQMFHTIRRIHSTRLALACLIDFVLLDRDKKIGENVTVTDVIFRRVGFTRHKGLQDGWAQANSTDLSIDHAKL